MKVAVIIGSGAIKGNTTALCDTFIRGCEDSGHEVRRVHLGELKVNPCVGCNGCRKTNICVQQDDFAQALEAFLWADCVTFASPLYFWSISAQLKSFIDRLYCIGVKDEKGFYFKYPKKKALLLMTCADISAHFYAFDLVDGFYNRLVRYMGWEDLGHYYATGCGGSSAPRRIEETRHLKAAYELGRKL